MHVTFHKRANEMPIRTLRREGATPESDDDDHNPKNESVDAVVGNAASPLEDRSRKIKHTGRFNKGLISSPDVKQRLMGSGRA
jgi:hypothetical protein